MGWGVGEGLWLRGVGVRADKVERGACLCVCVCVLVWRRLFCALVHSFKMSEEPNKEE